jgi:hypothetical protein
MISQLRPAALRNTDSRGEMPLTGLPSMVCSVSIR